MPNVTVYGAGSAGSLSVVTTPFNSTAAAVAAQNALNLISSAIVAQTVTPQNYAGSVPATSVPTELVFGSGAAVTIPSGSNYVALVSNATDPVSILNNASNVATVVSGAGGLTYTATGTATVGVYVGGGSNLVSLVNSMGVGTVSADGRTTINALFGSDSIVANAGGAASINVGGNDTVALYGTDTVVFNSAAASAVTAYDGSNTVFQNVGSGGAPIISLGSGRETTGTLTGSTVTMNAASSGDTIYLVTAWGGNTFLNPSSANVTVFGGSGSATLFGGGPGATNTNTGTDAVGLTANVNGVVITGATGYYQGGTAGGNLIVGSTTANTNTIIGGGAGDGLFSQSAGTSLYGAAGTILLNAAGYRGGSFTIAGAAGGDTLNAGASSAFLFGAASGGNTIISGSGAASVYGNHGSTGTSGNVYIDAKAGGSLTIEDFAVGSDIVKLQGSTVSNVATSSGAGGITNSTVTLSDNTKITLINVTVNGTNQSTIFS